MNFTALLNSVASLLVLLTAGGIANKLGVIDAISSKVLSKLIIRIGQPLLIISAMLKMEYSKENLRLGLFTFFIGVLIYTLISVIAFFSSKVMRDLDERKVTECAMILGNVGFIGFPLMEATFGAKGLFMAVFFNISFNIVLWTWCAAIYARKRPDIRLSIRKILINNGTVPAAIALLLYAFRIQLPEFLSIGISYVSSICTPISMMITGALIVTIPIKKLIGNWKTYYIAAFRMVIIPLVICVLTKLCGMTSLQIMFFTGISAMPVASTVSMFSDVYDIQPGFAAHAVGLSSILSLLTLPVVMLTAEWISSIPLPY